jgi:hypothetical protein
MFPPRKSSSGGTLLETVIDFFIVLKYESGVSVGSNHFYILKFFICIMSIPKEWSMISGG